MLVIYGSFIKFSGACNTINHRKLDVLAPEVFVSYLKTDLVQDPSEM